MNLSALLGILFGGLVFMSTVYFAFDNPFVLLDPRSFLIVFGGTVTAAMICFPFQQLRTLFVVFIKRVLADQNEKMFELMDEIKQASTERRRGLRNFENHLGSIKDPFLKECCEIILWGEEEISDTEIKRLLSERASAQYNRNMKDANLFKTIAQFPPAFGLMGTTIGMIALLQSLGEDGGENLGKSMAIALITTLYGLVFANFAFVPIAENLIGHTKSDFQTRQMIVNSVLLIHENKPTRYVIESAKTYLAPKIRNMR